MEVCSLFVFLVTFSIVAECQQRGVVVNSIFDFIMQNTKSSRMPGNFKTLPIPDMETNVMVGIEPFSLKASQGTLSDITTLHRIGDVSMDAQGNTATFFASVSLDVMKVVFRHYSLKAGLTGLVRWSGNKLAMNVKKNAFDAVLEVRFDGLMCNINMKHLNIRQFSDVQVDMEGFSVFNPIGSRIAEKGIQFFNGMVKGIVVDYAKKMVADVAKNKEICSTIFGQAVGGIDPGIIG